MFKRGLTNHGIKNPFLVWQPVTNRHYVSVCIVNKFVKNHVRKMFGFARVASAQIENQAVGRVLTDLRVVFCVWVGRGSLQQVGQDHFYAACENGYAPPLLKFSFASAASKARLGLVKRSQT